MNLSLPTTGVLSSATHLVFLLTKTFRTLLLASGLLIVFSMQANAQDGAFWSTLVERDDVKISVSFNRCDNPVLKLENKTDQLLTIEWKESILDYSSGDVFQLNSGKAKSMEIMPSSIMESDCADGVTPLNLDMSSVDIEYEVGKTELRITNLIVK